MRIMIPYSKDLIPVEIPGERVLFDGKQKMTAADPLWKEKLRTMLDCPTAGPSLAELIPGPSLAELIPAAGPTPTVPEICGSGISSCFRESR